MTHLWLLFTHRQLGRRDDLADCAPSVEEHTDQLDDHDHSEEDDEDQTNWLQFKVVVLNVDARVSLRTDVGHISLGAPGPSNVDCVLVGL